jgi:hypothetical protein
MYAENDDLHNTYYGYYWTRSPSNEAHGYATIVHPYGINMGEVSYSSFSVRPAMKIEINA